MNMGDILVLKGNEILALLADQEKALVHSVERAYIAHTRGESSLPFSPVLRFPDHPESRIAALPAYLGQDCKMAGLKWVASFPANLECGLDRASAVIILNSAQTGIPQAIIEGSVISAKRTAASAALAARYLQNEQRSSYLGIIGCGPINFEVVQFLLTLQPEIQTLVLYDINQERVQLFKHKCQELGRDVEIHIVRDKHEVLSSCPLVSMATTATTPHILDMPEHPSNAVILHISLRDLAPQVIVACDNIVDDIDHVSQAQTSIHLTEQLTGNRDCVRCTLADILLGKAPARKHPTIPTIFSPFGLGILDIAVSKFVYDLALREQHGTTLSTFLPTPWVQRVKQTAGR